MPADVGIRHPNHFLGAGCAHLGEKLRHPKQRTANGHSKVETTAIPLQRERPVHGQRRGRGVPESHEKLTTVCRRRRSGRCQGKGAVPPPETACPQRGARGRHRLCRRAAASSAAATSPTTSLPQSTRALQRSAHRQHPPWHGAASPSPRRRVCAHGQATVAKRRLVP